jgi:hypothetical protein
VIKSHRSASRVVFSTISTLVVISCAWTIGCGTSGVGSAPSNKEHVVEIYSKEDGSGQLKTKSRAGKNIQGPQSIKAKLFKPGDAPPAP